MRMAGRNVPATEGFCGRTSVLLSNLINTCFSQGFDDVFKMAEQMCSVKPGH